jgi:parallel beta-helix repeat protein
MLVSLPEIGVVKADSTIYIRADGSVEPVTTPISSVDNVTYPFSDNIYDEIVVERNDIVMDGSGYTLKGQGIGFYLDSINNVTIKRTLIKDFSRGIILNSSSFNVVSENNIINNSYGVNLYWSSNDNILTGNTITNNSYGIASNGGIV